MALTTWLNRLGPCALCGAIAGALTGFIFGFTQWGIPGNLLPIHVAVNVGLMLGLFAFLAIVFFIGVLGNFGLQRLVWPALFTSVLVSVLVVLIMNRLEAKLFGTLLGWLIGLIVGRALCYACARAVQVKER
jgi:hypothetical protein